MHRLVCISNPSNKSTSKTIERNLSTETARGSLFFSSSSNSNAYMTKCILSLVNQIPRVCLFLLFSYAVEHTSMMIVSGCIWYYVSVSPNYYFILHYGWCYYILYSWYAHVSVSELLCHKLGRKSGVIWERECVPSIRFGKCNNIPRVDV